MTEMNRRGFVKTLFLSAAGVAVVRGVPAETLGPELAESDTDAYDLENGEQKLRVASAGSLLSFQNYVRADGDWKASTLPNVPLVTGPSFPLKIQRVSPSATKLLCEGNAAARGLDGKTVEYPWKSEIESQKRTPWS